MCQQIVATNKEIKMNRSIRLRNLIIDPLSTLTFINAFEQSIENGRDSQ